MKSAKRSNSRIRAHLAMLGAWAVVATVGSLCAESHALVGSQRPAAILMFPFVDVRAGTRDTIIEIANTRDGPVTVRCFYVNGLGSCSNDATSICQRDSQCSPGATCIQTWTTSAFTFQLTAKQPVGWRVGASLSEPFTGELRCVEVSNSNENPPLVPVARNDLIGAATAVSIVFGSLPDTQSYTAIGIESTGLNNGDAVLCLGQNASGECTAAEYMACPAELRVSHLFQGADLNGTQMAGGLLFVSCSHDFNSRAPVTTQVVFEVTDEFEVRTSASTTVSWHTFVPFGSLSIFDAGFQGSLAGHTRVRWISTNETDVGHALVGIGSDQYSSNAGVGEAQYGFTTLGRSTQADLIRVPPAQCGDGACDPSESTSTCPADCPPPPRCTACTVGVDCPMDPFGGGFACPCRTEAGGATVCGASVIFSNSIGCTTSADCPAQTFCFAPFQNGALPGTCVACCGTDPAISTVCPDGRQVCGSVGSAGTQCCGPSQTCIFNPVIGAGTCQTPTPTRTPTVSSGTPTPPP